MPDRLQSGTVQVQSARREATLAYAIGAAIGVAAIWLMIPLATVLVTGGVWQHPGRDLAQNTTGHVLFQRDGWGWPLLFTPDVAWPHGLSIGLTDSNPLVSLIGKGLAGLVGRPVNLFGAWFALCWFAQPILAVYAVRGLAPAAGRRWEVAAASAALAVLCPELFQRYMHINLMGQFLLLAALGLAARMLAVDRPRWWAAAVLLCLAVLIHPYLFVFAALVLAAPLVRALPGPHRSRAAGSYLLAVGLPVGLFQLLSGSLGGNDRGFGFYSMNLLSPVWPQRSGLFGPALPILDPSGGQYEGFNYQGAGALLVIAAAIVMGGLRGWRRWWPLAAVLLVLTGLAVTQRVYAGPFLIVPLGLRPWDQIFGSVRSSGRAFWAVGYALVLGSVGYLGGRLPRPWLVGVLGAAVALQWVDTWPVRQEAQRYYAAGELNPPPMPALPPGGTLLRVLPVCMPPGPELALPDLLRWQGAQLGMRLADMRASRLPPWFNCESNVSDGLEAALAPGEIRVLIGPVAAGLHTDALTPGLAGPPPCRRQGDAVLCANGLALTGDLIQPSPPLPVVHRGDDVRGPRLAALLGVGWHIENDAWSEGPRSTLLFQLAGGSPARIVLDVRGIARGKGQLRRVTVAVGEGPAKPVDLPDGEDRAIEVPVEPGVVHVVFDIYRPVDPAIRGEILPVHRAGLELGRVQLLPP